MILVVPKNTLTAHNKTAITKKGYIIIECDEPEKIRVINPEQNMDTSDWFMAALHACSANVIPTSKAEYFVTELNRRLKKKEEPLPKEEISKDEAIKP